MNGLELLSILRARAESCDEAVEKERNDWKSEEDIKHEA
jgi:hypothetical protein